MKPVTLVIQAMGPYRGEEIIDFTILGEKRFFLIHGPTGSGKTSILDAITYALYGDTSGDERSLEQMRSHWADGETESYVQFDFYIGERLYRIRRRPKQTLNKKRGTGTREIDTEATLWSINGEPDVLETGALKVTKKIESLLGFNSEQFRQVIVLPQGKFRELLSAKAERREDILKVLFSTEKFTLIQNLIKERASTVKQKMESFNLERETILKGEDSESVDELKARLEAGDAEVEKLKVNLKRLKADEKAIDAEFQKASLVEARFAEMESAVEALKILEAKNSEMDGYAGVISICRRASGLKDLHKSLADEKVIYSGIEKKLLTAREEEAAAGINKLKAKEAADKLPAKERELKDLEQEIYRLESAGESYRALERAESETRSLDNKKNSTEAEHSALTKKRDELEVYIKKVQKQTGDAEVAGASIPALQGALERIVAAGKKTAELEKNKALAAELEKSISDNEEIKSAANKKLNEIIIIRSDIEERWIKGQAAVIAAGLADGEPCPVCGSLHHPSAATGSGEIPVMEELDRARRVEKEAEEKFRAVEKELIRKRSELDSLKNLSISTDDIPVEFRGMLRGELEERYKAESAKLKSADEAFRSLDTLKIKLSEDEKSLLKLIADIEESAKAVKDAEIALASLKSRTDQIKSGMPAGISDAAALHKKTDALKSQAAEVSRSIAGAEKAFQNSSEIYTAAKTLLDKCEKDHSDAKARLELKVSEFDARLSKEGFTSEQEFTGALNRAESVKEIEELLENHKTQTASAKDRLERASAGLDKLKRPDLSSISEKIVILKTEIDIAVGKLKSIESGTERLAKTIERINALNRSLESEEKNFGVIQTLAETAAGKNSMRLTFQRYVLQSLFEDVLMIASNRLERMSRGRYRLISPGRVDDRRSQGGLDLEVFDEYTGYSRPVVTLSGGEAFLASLSLALGLADLVQQYSGGIYLDTVFIDEGFGTLDSETLDLAINTLVDLQSSGRIVGIISHVNELRERIDARLEVIPEVYGSTTRFVV